MADPAPHLVTPRGFDLATPEGRAAAFEWATASESPGVTIARMGGLLTAYEQALTLVLDAQAAAGS